MRLLFIFLVIQIPYTVFCQYYVSINISHANTLSSSHDGSVSLIQNNKLQYSSTIDSCGNFNFQNIQEGEYEINYLYRFLSMKHTVQIYSDTSLTFTFMEKLAFEQPCRAVKEINNIAYDLPAIPSYLQGIRTRKLGLNHIVEMNEPIIARLWILPAFHYLSGTLIELKLDGETGEINKYTFHVNYHEIENTLHGFDYSEKDSLYFELFTFTITYKEQLQLGKDEKNFALENHIERIMNTEDFCKYIGITDWHCCSDGILYDLEIKYKNTFKFIHFLNPDKYSEKYKQVDAFLDYLYFLTSVVQKK